MKHGYQREQNREQKGGGLIHPSLFNPYCSIGKRYVCWGLWSGKGHGKEKGRGRGLGFDRMRRGEVRWGSSHAKPFRKKNKRGRLLPPLHISFGLHALPTRLVHNLNELVLYSLLYTDWPIVLYGFINPLCRLVCTEGLGHPPVHVCVFCEWPKPTDMCIWVLAMPCHFSKFN